MAEDEAGTIQTIRSYRALIQTLVEEHRGRVVDAPGDNLLAEFPTALDSVSAAAEIQRVLSARKSLPDFVYAHVMRAASEMSLGQEARARADVKRALELQPDLSLAFIRSVFISASDEYRVRLVDALRKAGLPEG